MRVDWVTVYGYKRWHRGRQQLVVSPRKATIAALAAMPGSTLIEGTAEQVPSHLVDADGLYAEPVAALAISGGPGPAHRATLLERRHG